MNEQPVEAPEEEVAEEEQPAEEAPGEGAHGEDSATVEVKEDEEGG